MFDTVDTVHDCIRIATGVISTIKIFPDKMMAGLSADMLATDLAEYLVRKGARDYFWACEKANTRPTCTLLSQLLIPGRVKTCQDLLLSPSLLRLMHRRAVWLL